MINEGNYDSKTYDCVIIGQNSDCFGRENVIIGANNYAKGDGNLILGAGCKVNGNRCVVLGNNLEVNGDNQVVCNKFDLDKLPDFFLKDSERIKNDIIYRITHHLYQWCSKK